MHPDLAAQRRYLAALRDAAAARPEVHANQLAALDRELALASDAPSAAAYRVASGDLFELARAAWLDRLAAHARVAAAVDDPWSAEACAIEHGAALAARGPTDWSTCLTAAAAASAGLRARGADALAGYAMLCVNALRWRSEVRAGARAEAAADAGASLAMLRAADPRFDGDVEGIARYRWRTPFRGSGLRSLRDWWNELAASQGDGTEAGVRAHPERRAADALGALDAAAARWRAALREVPGGASGTVEPSVADAVAPYAALAQALASDDPVPAATRTAATALVDAAAGAPTAQDALALWVERGLLTELARAPLRAVAAHELARAAEWEEPLRVHHARASLAALAACRTPTEVDLVAAHADACLAVETAWNTVLLAGLFAPIRAAFARGCNDGPEATASVAAAWDLVRALLGAGSELLAVPRVRGFLRSVVVRHGFAAHWDLGAFRAEAGFEVLAEARSYFGVAREDGRITACDEASVDAALRPLLGSPAPGMPARVHLWDQEVALADLETAIAASRRPAIPGMFGVQIAGGL